MGSHDKLFKAVFSEPENAIAHFGAFLPAEITAALDLSQAVHEPGSFVDETLRERHTDLLYRIPWKKGFGEGDREVLLFVIFEHQSTPDPMMPFRMLRYAVRIWERWIREHPEQRQLQPILPLVLYHGEQDWTVARSLFELFDLADVPSGAVEALKPYLPRLRIMLNEVASLPDEQIPGHGAVRLTLLLFKTGRIPDVLDLVPSWTEEFRMEAARGKPGLRILSLLVEYLLRVNENVSVGALAEFLAPLGDEIKEIPMTVGEQLIEKGRQEGRQEGEAAGRHKEKLDVARKALAKGMSPVDVADLTDLPVDEVQTLAH